MTLPDRFWAKVDKSGECWLWTAGTNTYGYGRLQLNGKARMAHRLSYESLVGPIPEGLVIDHLCRVRRCVNPDHLEPVAPSENTHRGDAPAALNGRKSQCVRGHDFDEENTRYDSRGCRQCRACQRLYPSRIRTGPFPCPDPTCDSGFQTARGATTHALMVHSQAVAS